jgi:hypothetical protein
MAYNGTQRWSRDEVLDRISSMASADALLAIELYNERHFRDAEKHIDPAIAVGAMTPAEAEDIRRRVAALHLSAVEWGRKYWEKRLQEAQKGLPHGDDAEIMAEMAARHPGFSIESLTDVYNIGFMLAR